MSKTFLLLAAACALAACGGNPPAATTAPRAAATTAAEPAKPAEKSPETAATAPPAGGQAQNPRQAPTAAPSQGGAAPTAAPEATKPPLVKATAVPTQASSAGDNGSVLGELNENLSSLKSYRMKWLMQWDGKDKDGKPQKGSFTLFQEFITASKDQHTQYAISEDGAPPEQFEVFNIGQDYYMYSPEKTGDEKCVSGSGAGIEGASSLLKPADIFGDMKNAKLVKKGELVNGVMTDHYQVDEKSAGIAGFTSGSGDLWVAQDGKYTVKYTGKFTGKDGALDADMVDGTVSWNYDLTDVNKVSAITPPADCKKPGISLPLPDDASEKTSMQGMVMFKTKLDAAAVVDFYKTRLTALGYKVDSENTTGDVAMLNMSKDKATVLVMISKEGGASQVIIQEGQ